MTIERNGISITLTYEEIMNIHKKYEYLCRTEDIKSVLFEDFENDTLITKDINDIIKDRSTMNAIVRLYGKYLDESSNWIDCAIGAIKDCLEEKGIRKRGEN